MVGCRIQRFRKYPLQVSSQERSATKLVTRPCIWLENMIYSKSVCTHHWHSK